MNDSLLLAHKVNAELDMLLETINLIGRSEDSMKPYLYAVVRRLSVSIYRNIDLFHAECPVNIGERIKQFGTVVREDAATLVTEKDDEQQHTFNSGDFKRNIWTLKNLIALGTKKIREDSIIRDSMANVKVERRVKAFLSAVLVISIILLVHIIVLLLKIKDIGKALGLKKSFNSKEVLYNIENMKENFIKDSEEINKKLFREQISGRRKSVLLDTIPAGMISISSNNEVTYINQKMKNRFKFEENIIGENISTVHSKLGIDKFENGKLVIDGDFYWISVHEELNEIFVVLRDITEQEKLARKLLDSERLVSIGEMASRITHEIRNPLSTIKLNSEYMVENIDDVDRPHIVSSMKLIVKEVNRLEIITEKYMNLVKYRSSVEIEKETELPDDLVQFISFHSTEFKKRNIEVVIKEIPECELAITVSSFKEIMLNLIKNAWEELNSEGRVVVKVDIVSKKAIITVDDSGRGIPDNEKQAVFQNFYTKKPGGTGIGLSHSRKLAEEAGGQLTVSDSELGGACFILELNIKSKV